MFSQVVPPGLSRPLPLWVVLWLLQLQLQQACSPPVAPVLLCLSLPARSTRLSLPTRTWPSCRATGSSSSRARSQCHRKCEAHGFCLLDSYTHWQSLLPLPTVLYIQFPFAYPQLHVLANAALSLWSVGNPMQVTACTQGPYARFCQLMLHPHQVQLASVWWLCPSSSCSSSTHRCRPLLNGLNGDAEH